jgi:hypothetical protein
MSAMDYQRVQCPYCGESIVLQVDDSAGEQEYIEDCSVCCRPIEVRLSWDGDGWRLAARRDDE